MEERREEGREGESGPHLRAEDDDTHNSEQLAIILSFSSPLSLPSPPSLPHLVAEGADTHSRGWLAVALLLLVLVVVLRLLLQVLVGP